MSNVVPVVEICFASGHVAYGREEGGEGGDIEDKIDDFIG